MKAFLIIDIQNDFLSGGALAVPDGDAIIPVVNRLQQQFDLVIATQDWHPPGHKSFASSHPGRNVFDKTDLNGLEQVLWPDHCIHNSFGAAFHPALEQQRIEAIFRKGTDPEIDSYSGFYDNGHRKSTGLAGYLREKGVEQVYIAGLAADFCVYYSVRDALSEGFDTFLIEEGTRAINPQEYGKIREDIKARGGRIIEDRLF